MKNILIFGDSNMWGYIAPTEERYPYGVRCPGRVQAILGGDYRVVEDALNGRTYACADCMFGDKNGTEQLMIALECHRPLDLLCVMLGTNDCKSRFAMTPTEIAYAAANMVIKVKNFNYVTHKCPEILLITPPEITGDIHKAPFGEMFGDRAIELSRRLPAAFDALLPPNGGSQFGAHLFHASAVCRPGTEDGLHLDARGHAALAEALAREIRGILG
ncbi:MAG: GDSL-type esterase/lipase family protein [Clostridiaceae bacterium]|nr:GDSL-type esterase/lipase family protein [Clostridiaceae bacterium]